MDRITRFFKSLWHRVINPSIVQAVTAIIIGSIFIAAAVVLSLSDTSDIGAYFCYAFAFLSLVYIGYIICYGYPRVKQRTLEFAAKYTFTSNLVKNYGYRTMVMACASIALNALYAIYNGALAIHYWSVWCSLLAVYYLLLCILRGGLLTGTRVKGNEHLTPSERAEQNIKLYVNCGIFLIVFTFLIIGAIVRIAVAEGNPRAGTGFPIFVSGLYTFIRFGFSAYNIRKAKKWQDFGTRALRNINFADALVALFSFQVSLTSVFGEGQSNRVLNMATGVAVCGIIVFMGIYMIAAGRRALKRGRPLKED